MADEIPPCCRNGADFLLGAGNEEVQKAKQDYSSSNNPDGVAKAAEQPKQEAPKAELTTTKTSDAPKPENPKNSSSSTSSYKAVTPSSQFVAQPSFLENSFNRFKDPAAIFARTSTPSSSTPAVISRDGFANPKAPKRSSPSERSGEPSNRAASSRESNPGGNSQQIKSASQNPESGFQQNIGYRMELQSLIPESATTSRMSQNPESSTPTQRSATDSVKTSQEKTQRTPQTLAEKADPKNFLKATAEGKMPVNQNRFDPPPMVAKNTALPFQNQPPAQNLKTLPTSQATMAQAIPSSSPSIKTPAVFQQPTQSLGFTTGKQKTNANTAQDPSAKMSHSENTATENNAFKEQVALAWGRFWKKLRKRKTGDSASSEIDIEEEAPTWSGDAAPVKSKTAASLATNADKGR